MAKKGRPTGNPKTNVGGFAHKGTPMPKVIRGGRGQLKGVGTAQKG